MKIFFSEKIYEKELIPFMLLFLTNKLDFSKRNIETFKYFGNHQIKYFDFFIDFNFETIS